MKTLIILAVLLFLSWRIYEASQRIGNPFQKVAEQIERAAESKP